MNNNIEILNEAYSYAERLNQGIEVAVEAFRAGDDRKGFNTLSYITEGLDWLIEAISMTQEIQKEKITDLNIQDIMKEAIEAMENNDTTLLADLLEYEIGEKVVSWKEKLKLSIEA